MARAIRAEIWTGRFWQREAIVIVIFEGRLKGRYVRQRTYVIVERQAQSFGWHWSSVILKAVLLVSTVVGPCPRFAVVTP